MITRYSLALAKSSILPIQTSLRRKDLRPKKNFAKAVGDLAKFDGVRTYGELRASADSVSTWKLLGTYSTAHAFAPRCWSTWLSWLAAGWSAAQQERRTGGYRQPGNEETRARRYGNAKRREAARSAQLCAWGDCGSYNVERST